MDGAIVKADGAGIHRVMGRLQRKQLFSKDDFYTRALKIDDVSVAVMDMARNEAGLGWLAEANVEFEGDFVAIIFVCNYFCIGIIFTLQLFVHQALKP